MYKKSDNLLLNECQVYNYNVKIVSKRNFIKKNGFVK